MQAEVLRSWGLAEERWRLRVIHAIAPLAGELLPEDEQHLPQAQARALGAIHATLSRMPSL